jgi:hypothetical protein
MNQRAARVCRAVFTLSREADFGLSSARWNLWPIGRYGSFKYNNQDHSILMGLLVADNICDDAAHDLWNVNVDYGSYQEGGRSAAQTPVP